MGLGLGLGLVLGFVNPPHPPILNVGKQEQVLEDVSSLMQSNLRPG